MDSVLFWNEVALQAVADDHSVDAPEQGGPTFTARALAIVHTAMYDASNAFVKTHRPYMSVPQPPAGGSVESAIAGAGISTLLALYPNQAAPLQAAYTKALFDGWQNSRQSTCRGFGIFSRVYDEGAR